MLICQWKAITWLHIWWQEWCVPYLLSSTKFLQSKCAWTWPWPLEYAKIKCKYAKWKSWHNFIFDDNINVCSISHHLWDIRKWNKMPKVWPWKWRSRRRKTGNVWFYAPGTVYKTLLAWKGMVLNEEALNWAVLNQAVLNQGTNTTDFTIFMAQLSMPLECLAFLSCLES